MIGIGQVLEGKYRLVRLLGEGGMGRVFEAEHLRLPRRVAIKVLAPEFSRSPQAVGRFHREAQAAAGIGHDNICEVTDIGRTPDGSPYIVMPVLQGRSLSADLAQSAPLPFGRAVDLAAQMLDGLAAAHAAGIIHRDMKPDNVFLTRLAGREDFVKLLDFGVSKVRGSGPERIKLTRTGAIMGTPEYMSPEQARGASDVDERTDVWAVGVMLYEMLTGKPPFTGQNYNSIMYAILHDPVPAVRTKRREAPPELEAVVMKALERDPEARWRTAVAFRDALRDAARTLGLGVPSVPEEPARILVMAHPGTPTDGPTDAFRPDKHAMLVPRPVDATLAGTTVSPPSVMRPPRARALRWVALAMGVAVVGAVAAVLLLSGRGSSAASGRSGAPPEAAPVVAAGPAESPGPGLPESGGLPRPGPTIAGQPGTAALPAGSARGSAVELSSPVPPPPVPPPPGSSPVPVASPGPDATTTPPAAPTGGPTSEPPAATGPGPGGRPTGPESGPPLATTGTLSVTTNPRTEVFLDGQSLGSTPVRDRTVSAGRHRLLFVSDEWAVRHEEDVDVHPGEQVSVQRSARALGARMRPPGGTADAGGTASVPSSPEAGTRRDGIWMHTTYGRDGR